MKNRRLANRSRRRLLQALLLAAITVSPGTAQAACSSPAGLEGDLRYDSVGKVYSYCDDVSWIDWASGGGGTLSGLSDTTISSPTNGECLTYSGSAWVNGSCGGTATPAGADREIQFNSGGALGAATNFVYTAVGDLIVGSYQTNDTGTGNEDRRMFFDKSTGAFRTGYVDGTQWDDANIGDYSVAIGQNTRAPGIGGMAMGYQTQANGAYSVAMGWSSEAGGQYSVAMGWDSLASGWHSTAMGYGTTASGGNGSTAMGNNTTASGSVSTAMGASSTASGHYSVAIGRSATVAGEGSFAAGRSVNITATGDYSAAFGLSTAVPATAPQVTAAESFAIFMGNRSGYVMSEAQTLALIGGKIMIDGDSTSTDRGCIRFEETTNKLQFSHDCSTYSDFGSGGGGGAPTGNDREIQFNSGGALGASSTFKLMSDGDLLLTGTYTGTASVPVSGAGTRVFFDTQAAAFRAGYVGGADWDDAKIGNYSVALGWDTTASGESSVAIGRGTTASGSYSTAMGNTTTTAGDYSLVAGNRVDITAAGDASAAFGLTTTTPATDPQVTAAESFAIFMGNRSGYVMSDTQTFALIGGKILIDGDSTSTDRGCIRFEETSNKLQFSHDCSTYSDFGSGGGGALDDLSDAAANYTDNNIFIGHEGGAVTSTDNFNTAIGVFALDSLDGTGGGSDYNTAVGYNALTSLTDGHVNTAVGVGALTDTTTGHYNTAVGANSLWNNVSGNFNTAAGYRALMETTSGGNNVGIGYQALVNNTSGTSNTVVGHLAGGISSAANGDMDGNSLFGFQSGYNLTGGASGAGPNYNTLIGYAAGDLITTGDDNIMIGKDTDPPAATDSFKLNIGNTIYGDLSTDTVGIGQPSPNDGKLEVKGGTVCVDTNSDDSASSCIANESDKRLKKNIREIDYGLGAVMALRPVSFDWRYDDPDVLKHYPLISRFTDHPRSIGLIAQDVQPVVPEAIEPETVGDGDVQYLQLDYAKLVPVLIKATQEQQAQIETLKAANDNQKATIHELAARVRALESR